MTPKNRRDNPSGKSRGQAALTQTTKLIEECGSSCWEKFDVSHSRSVACCFVSSDGRQAMIPNVNDRAAHRTARVSREMGTGSRPQSHTHNLPSRNTNPGDVELQQFEAKILTFCSCDGDSDCSRYTALRRSYTARVCDESHGVWCLLPS